MPAGVVENADSLIIAADDHNRIATDIVGHITASFVQLTCRGGEQPTSMPDFPKISLEYLRVRKKSSGQ